MAAFSGIVTPEGVVLEFPTGDVGSRLIAKLIDLVIQVAILFALLLASSVVGGVIAPLGLAGVFLSVFVVVLGYPAAFETLWHGRTPGKAALGLRVVTVEGSPVRFRHGAIRAILGLIDFYLFSGVVAILTVAFTAKNQRVGDLVAGTIVVRERTGAARPTPAQFFVPPGYESYAATLDVTGLSAADYGAARAFLLRASGLEPSARYELARQIATPLLGRLRHTPPPSVTPEAFLLCVAAVYQYRQRLAAGPPPPTGQGYQQAWWPPPSPVGPVPAPSQWAGSASGWADPAAWPVPASVPVPVPAPVPAPPNDTDGFIPPA